MLARFRVRLDQKYCPISLVGTAAPYLLPIDDKIIAVLYCPGLDISHVRAGFRLRVKGAPYLLGAEDFRNKAFLLFLSAVSQDSRSAPTYAVAISRTRCAVLCHLLVENYLLHEAGTATAVFFGP